MGYFIGGIGMFRVTPLFFRLRPRNIANTPPPLARRAGDFVCHNCKHSWSSRHVWVTQVTHKCYQGESCDKCGAANRPKYVHRLEKDDFWDTRKTPHVYGRGKSTSRSMKDNINAPRFARSKMRVPGRRHLG